MRRSDVHSVARVILAAATFSTLGVRLAAGQDRVSDDRQLAPARPGLWRLGALYVTPKLRIGTLGLDSNVFYTPTERQTDFTASGGPGLELVLPMGSLRLRLEGSADYLYFARTESQRRWGGDARAQLEWAQGRVAANAERAFARTFSRPSFEVDRRVLQDQWATRGSFALRIAGGLTAKVQASQIENEAKDAADFLGADIESALSRDETRFGGEIKQAVTPKTSLVAGGDQQVDRFPVDATRDADSNRAYGGFEIESQTRLNGRAVGGIRFYRPRHTSRGSDLREPYADVSLSYRFGPRTELGARYNRDLTISTFEPTSGPPTLSHESYELRFQMGLPARLDLQLFGAHTRLTSFAPVTVERTSGTVETAVRDDRVWQGGADLGFRFRSHYRLGFAATYTDRRSTFDDFGIEGLLFGATLKYLP